MRLQTFDGDELVTRTIAYCSNDTYIFDLGVSRARLELEENDVEDWHVCGLLA